ncbi:T9SS type A sorting domain-containing protein [Hymenobacter norwichensis]|uniref:T9SS type A sorting domain-containing protein n=1 Tax=Hymenobacter norwichensis TaxID=223903 RepID=UPI0003B4481A|nr:T9SS type A sorting domain-containing protein [Hymenobacter norwichensis]
MQNLYTASWQKLAFAAVLAASAATAQGQTRLRNQQPITPSVDYIQAGQPTASRTTAIGYTSGQGQNVAGTYTDLGTTGTAITTANLDDASSAAQNIGFTFNYNGVAFTQFVLNTNGFIKLGAVAPTLANDLRPLINATDANIIAPASGVDLQGAADQTANPTEFRMATTGTAPNRVCTIQFKNLRDKATPFTGGSVPPQFATMQFQVKLYESSSNIEFVYGVWTATTSAADYQPFRAGLKANALPAQITLASLSEVSLLRKEDTDPWSATTFANTFTDGSSVYISTFDADNSVLPDAGRTYRFRLAPAVDAATQVIYSVGKAPVSAPQVVQAVVTNLGTTALTGVPVTLGVTGATTFTDVKLIPSLAVGASATVTFSAYTPTTVGNNTLTVTAAAASDGQATNNAQTFTQAVTANNISYIEQNQPVTNALSVSSTTPDGILAVKYTAASQATVGEVRINFPDNPNPSTYQVVVLGANSAGLPGTTLFTSTTQTRPTTAGVVTVPVTGTISVNGTFFVGVKEVTGGSAVGYQQEQPLRAGTFYAQVSGSWVDIGTQFPARLAIEAGFSSRVLNTNSPALSKAVTMYPNPSNGVVKVDVRGASAKGALNVSVVNTLGQTVYTNSLKDNFLNEVNLSSLANGIYTLKVQTGSEFTSRQLVLTK